MNNKLIGTLSFMLTVVTLAACSGPQNESGINSAQEETANGVILHDKLARQKKSDGDQLRNRVIESKISEQELVTFPVSPESSLITKTKGKVERRRVAKSMPGLIYNKTYQVNLNDIRHTQDKLNTENYAHLDQNSIIRVAEKPVSTFSIDVDTGAYSNMRRFLNSGSLPRKDAIRIEELVNYFNYDYPQPQNNEPFSVVTEIAPTPWNKNSYLLHIGIKGLDVSKKNLPASNLVFLVDVSGSMQSANKLELLKTSLKLLTKRLRAQDKISLVVYAGASGVVLQPTSGNQTATISAALDKLYAGGSTNGAAGIKLAYSLAEQAFIKNGINRIILATDGDFNVGTVNFEALTDLIEQKRKSGISLTTLGFGSGNYNDHLMEQLADKGNGNYHYIDTLNEAQKVLVDEMSSTLHAIAKDVKIQIEFNKRKVAEYRLIGYENRVLKREDFNNDKIDAGEIGAGHTVTALYEITLLNSKQQSVDSLRYQFNEKNISLSKIKSDDKFSELAFLKIRYKAPTENTSQLLTWPLNSNSIVNSVSKSSDRFRFSAAVAAFGQKLKGGRYTKHYTYDEILNLARQARGKDNFGYRGEFIKLVNLAKSLS